MRITPLLKCNWIAVLLRLGCLYCVLLFGSLYTQAQRHVVVDDTRAILGLDDGYTFPVYQVEPLDISEAMEHRESRGKSTMFSYACDADIDVMASQPFSIGGGLVLISVDVVAPGAYGLSLRFDSFFLPEGCLLQIASPDLRTEKAKQYDVKNNKRRQSLVIGGIALDRATVSLICPENLTDSVKLHIDKVYRQFIPSLAVASNAVMSKNVEQVQRKYGWATGSCHIPIDCDEGVPYCVEKDAVALIEYYDDESSRICTSTLLNNTNEDRKGYLLTAWHCLNLDSGDDCTLSTDDKGRIEDFRIVFRYQWTGCTGTETEADGNAYGEFAGCTFVMGHRDTDVALIRILEDDEDGEYDPDADVELVFAGWSRSTTLPSSGVSIHHPEGDIMMLAELDEFASTGYGYDCSDGTYGNGGTTNDADYWHCEVVDGALEAGSSGAALFDENYKVRGVLSHLNEQRICEFTEIHITEANYGKISEAWDGGGTSTTRLKDHLDPANDDPTELRAWHRETNVVKVYNQDLKNSNTWHRTEEIEGLTGVGDGDAAFYVAAPTILQIGGKRNLGSGTGALFEVQDDVSAVFTAANIVKLTCGTRIYARDESGTATQFVDTRVKAMITHPECVIEDATYGDVHILREDYPSSPTVEGCGSGAVVRPLAESTIDQREAPVTIVVRPNPARSQVWISVDGKGKFRVLTIDGQIVHASKANSEMIDVSSWARGTYYIVATEGGLHTGTKRFAIMK